MRCNYHSQWTLRHIFAINEIKSLIANDRNCHTSGAVGLLENKNDEIKFLEVDNISRFMSQCMILLKIIFYMVNWRWISCSKSKWEGICMSKKIYQSK